MTRPIRTFYSEKFYADIGDHIMPMKKFGLVRQALETEGLPVRIVSPEPVTEEDLLRVHTAEYVRAVASGEPRALAESQKFPWSRALAESVLWTNGACVAALEAALEDGVAAALASGFHHAHADHGEGFCTFNGLVVAMERARAKKLIERALVVDLDLHYGNGTVSLLATRPSFSNLSVYGNFYKDNRAIADVTEERAPDSDTCWSVPVPSGADGPHYLALLEEALPSAIARARPDVILYQAGADPFRGDPYSPLVLEAEDLAMRDEMVFAAASAAGVPVAWVLAGGYTRDVNRIVEVHVNTFRAAVAVYEHDAAAAT